MIRLFINISLNSAPCDRTRSLFIGEKKYKQLNHRSQTLFIHSQRKNVTEQIMHVIGLIDYCNVFLLSRRRIMSEILSAMVTLLVSAKS
jgi:hypothetical protein